MANTTWNPSDISGVVLSGGNLTVTASTLAGAVRAIDAQFSGKYYFEATLTTNGSTWDFGVGLAAKTAPLTFNSAGNAAGPAIGINRGSGNFFVNTTSTVLFSAVIPTGTTVGIAADLTNRLIWFRQGSVGNWNNNAANNPATGAGGLIISLDPLNWYPFAGFSGVAGGQNVVANFGDSAFVGAVPSGFTAGWTAGANPPNIAAATSVALEQWAMPNAQAQLTQVALEAWQSVGATTIKSGTYTYVVSGSRAGLSGAVAETRTRTYPVAMPAVLTEGYVAPPVSPSTQGARVMVMA